MFVRVISEIYSQTDIACFIEWWLALLGSTRTGAADYSVRRFFLGGECTR